MKSFYITLFSLMSLLSYGQTFDDNFYEKTLRIDYIHAGDSEHESYYFESLKEEPHFAGSKSTLIDDNNFGMQRLEVYDIESNTLIYSRGFCVLFTEWQSTPEAKLIEKAYRESMVMPFPKKDVRIEIHSRNRQGVFEKKFEHLVDVNSIYIEKRVSTLDSFDILSSGEPASKVDIVFLSEGYAADEYDKFKADCENFKYEIFKFSPFKERESDFNIRGVWAPSQDSDITNPGKDMWHNTALEAKFFTFESDRYQMVDDFQKVRDVASTVPYDLIYILSNTETYGGGAIYNFYGISSSSHPTEAGRVFVHEFGHLLLGLGDEYEGDASVEEFYPEGIEPWEVNLTRNIDFDKKVIWNSLLDKSTPIPTEECAENSNVVGLYEGGGYASEGIYRPWVNCIMRTLNDGGYCPVCKGGINQMIDFIISTSSAAHPF